MHGTDVDNFVIYAAVLIFQYCVWEAKLKKKIHSYTTLELLFRKIIYNFLRTNSLARNQKQNLILNCAGLCAMESTSETGNQCQAPLPFEMSEKIKQIDPAGLLNEDCSDQEMDTQDQPGANIEQQEQKKKPVHNVSSSGEEEEEEDVVDSAADTRPPDTAAAGDAAANAGALPKDASLVANPGFRIVDIEPNGSGSGFSVQPMQMAQTAVNTATALMNVNKETGVPTHNPPPQLSDSAATNYCPATDPVPGQSYTCPSKKLSAAIAKAKDQNRNVKNIESGGKSNQNENTFKKVPTGVKNPEIPPKTMDVSEADAVPSKTYSAIISNKKKNEKASTICGIASGQDPTECGSFFNPGDNRILRSVYKEDVTSGSVSSMSFNPVTWMCTVCPRSHSVFEVKTGEGGRAGGRTDIVLCDQNFPAVFLSVEPRGSSMMVFLNFFLMIQLFRTRLNW